ncbi:MAG TPA: DUF4340 domain-containing protein [Bryobacteraceae bacterium]|nr:DUF4340 domain-containing protein [Bryobacteraceae bacterium]
MQVRGLLAGLIVLAVLGGLVWWSNRTEAEKAAAPAGSTSKLFAVKDDEVRRVEIARRGSEQRTVVERSKDGWQITAPEPLRADNDAVAGLVSAFTGLTEDRVIEEKPANLAEFGLSDPQARVTVNGKHTLLIGDDTPTGGAVYAKLEGSPKVFTFPSQNKSNIDKDAKDLRDKRLVTADTGKLSRVELTSRGATVELSRNAQKEWQILRPRQLRADNLAVDELVRKLQEARMDLSEDPEEAAKKFAAGARTSAAVLADAAGSQTLELRKSGDAYYARSSAVPGVYKVDSTLGEALSKGLDDLRNKKLFDFGFSDPSKIEIRVGTQQHSFVKGGEKWWSNGKQMDATGVQSLIDKLRDLSSAAFAEGSVAPADLEIAVTAGDGKKTEKVLIGRNGLAQREGEPAVYKLDANAVEELRKTTVDVKAAQPSAAAPPK